MHARQPSAARLRATPRSPAGLPQPTPFRRSSPPLRHPCRSLPPQPEPPHRSPHLPPSPRDFLPPPAATCVPAPAGSHPRCPRPAWRRTRHPRRGRAAPRRVSARRAAGGTAPGLPDLRDRTRVFGELSGARPVWERRRRERRRGWRGARRKRGRKGSSGRRSSPSGRTEDCSGVMRISVVVRIGSLRPIQRAEARRPQVGEKARSRERGPTLARPGVAGLPSCCAGS